MRHPFLKITFVIGSAVLFLQQVGFSQGRQPTLPALEPVAVEAGERFSYRAVEDGSGGFYYIWTHFVGERHYQLRAQYESATGARAWGREGLLLASEVSSPSGWDAFSDGKTGVIVTWQFEARLYAQRLTATNERLWPKERETVSISKYPQVLPAGVPDGGGGAYLVWSEKRYEDRVVLMMQHMNALGVPLWPPEGLRVSPRNSDQRRAVAVYDGTAGMIVVWKDFRESASQLKAQRIDFQGNRLWEPEGIIVTAPAGTDRQPPSLAPIGEGAAVVAWEAASAGVNDILIQLLGPDGKFLWNPLGLDFSLSRAEQWNPVLHGDGQGGIWIAWEDFRDQANWQVYAQHIAKTGEPVWPADVPLAPGRGSQGTLSINDDGDGGFYTAWIDSRIGKPGIYAQELSADGQLLLGPRGVPIAEVQESPSSIKVLPLGKKKVAVFWIDQPDKLTWKLYVRRENM